MCVRMRVLFCVFFSCIYTYRYIRSVFIHIFYLALILSFILSVLVVRCCLVPKPNQNHSFTLAPVPLIGGSHHRYIHRVRCVFHRFYRNFVYKISKNRQIYSFSFSLELLNFFKFVYAWTFIEITLSFVSNWNNSFFGENN